MIIPSNEHDTQVAYFSIIHDLIPTFPILYGIFAIPNGGQRHIAVARKMKAEGVLAGVWDVKIDIPIRTSSTCFLYPGMWIEFKYGKGKLSANQEIFGEFVRMQGYKTFVSWTWQDAVKETFDYLGIELPDGVV